MRILLGLAGLAVALLTWGIAIAVSQGGLPYLDKDAGALITWLLFCPAVLCFLPLAGMALQRNPVAAVWWVAVSWNGAMNQGACKSRSGKNATDCV